MHKNLNSNPGNGINKEFKFFQDNKINYLGEGKLSWSKDYSKIEKISFIIDTDDGRYSRITNSHDTGFTIREICDAEKIAEIFAANAAAEISTILKNKIVEALKQELQVLKEARSLSDKRFFDLFGDDEDPLYQIKGTYQFKKLVKYENSLPRLEEEKLYSEILETYDVSKISELKSIFAAKVAKIDFKKLNSLIEDTLLQLRKEDKTDMVLSDKAMDNLKKLSICQLLKALNKLQRVALTNRVKFIVAYIISRIDDIAAKKYHQLLGRLSLDQLEQAVKGLGKYEIGIGNLYTQKLYEYCLVGYEQAKKDNIRKKFPAIEVIESQLQKIQSEKTLKSVSPKITDGFEGKNFAVVELQQNRRNSNEVICFVGRKITFLSNQRDTVPSLVFDGLTVDSIVTTCYQVSNCARQLAIITFQDCGNFNRGKVVCLARRK